MRGERVALELVQRVRARARHHAVELPERPREPAVHGVPGAPHVDGVPAADARPARALGDAGSAAAGDIEEPIRAGPPSSAGAPTPVRKRRMAVTSLRAWARLGTPARMFHGCGSPKIAPVPIGPLIAEATVEPTAGPLTALRGAQLRPAPAQRAREGAVAARVGQLRQPRVHVGQLRRHERRLVHAEEHAGEVRPVAGERAAVAAVGPAQRLLMGIRPLEVGPERRRRRPGKAPACRTRAGRAWPARTRPRTRAATGPCRWTAAALVGRQRESVP